MKYLGVTISLVFFSSLAYGKCATVSDVQQVNAASAIFIATIVSGYAKEQRNDVTLVFGKYHLLEILKGKTPQNGTVASSLSDVGIPLTPGFVYLFFTGGTPKISWCTGSRRLNFYNAPFPNDDKILVEHIKKLVADEGNLKKQGYLTPPP